MITQPSCAGRRGAAAAALGGAPRLAGARARVGGGTGAGGGGARARADGHRIAGAGLIAAHTDHWVGWLGQEPAACAGCLALEVF